MEYGHLAEDPWVQENLNDVRTLARFIQDYGDAYTTLNFISNLDENYYQRFHQDEQIFKLAMVNLDVSCEEQRLLTCRKKFVDAEFGGYGERFFEEHQKNLGDCLVDAQFAPWFRNAAQNGAIFMAPYWACNGDFFLENLGLNQGDLSQHLASNLYSSGTTSYRFLSSNPFLILDFGGQLTAHIINNANGAVKPYLPILPLNRSLFLRDDVGGFLDAILNTAHNQKVGDDLSRETIFGKTFLAEVYANGGAFERALRTLSSALAKEIVNSDAGDIDLGTLFHLTNLKFFSRQSGVPNRVLLNDGLLLNADLYEQLEQQLYRLRLNKDDFKLDETSLFLAYLFPSKFLEIWDQETLANQTISQISSRLSKLRFLDLKRYSTKLVRKQSFDVAVSRGELVKL